MRVHPGFRTAALALCLAAVMACAAHAAPRTGPRLAAPGGSDEEFLAAYSQASADWGDGIEATIEEAYRKCFRTYIISGRVITLHLPFAENNERSELAGSLLSVEGGGKADPLALWDQIDTIIASPDFSRYAAELSDGHEKVLSFDLTARTWSASRDWYAIDQMKAGSYPGLPHRPTVLASGKGLTPLTSTTTSTAWAGSGWTARASCGTCSPRWRKRAGWT